MQIVFNVLATLGALGAAVDGWFTWARRGYTAWTVARPEDDSEARDGSGAVLAIRNTGDLDAHDVRLTIISAGGFVDEVASTPHVHGKTTWLASTQREITQLRGVQVDWRRRSTSRRRHRRSCEVTIEELYMGRRTVPLLSEHWRVKFVKERPRLR